MSIPIIVTYATAYATPPAVLPTRFVWHGSGHDGGKFLRGLPRGSDGGTLYLQIDGGALLKQDFATYRDLLETAFKNPNDIIVQDRVEAYRHMFSAGQLGNVWQLTQTVQRTKGEIVACFDHGLADHVLKGSVEVMKHLLLAPMHLVR